MDRYKLILIYLYKHYKNMNAKEAPAMLQDGEADSDGEEKVTDLFCSSDVNSCLSHIPINM